MATWCRPGEGWTHGPVRRRDRGRLDVRARRRRVEIRLSPAMPWRCWRSGASGLQLARRRSSCISPTTRKRAARSGRGGCWRRASASPTTRSAPASPTRWSTHITAPASRGRGARALRPRREALRPASTRWRRRRAILRRSIRMAADARGSRRRRAGHRRPQLTVGLISGGINTNVVPDRVTFRLDRRIVPEERGAEVEAELRRVIEEAARTFPRRDVAIRRILLAEPLTPLPGSERLSDALCAEASRSHGRAGRDERRAALHGCAPLCSRRRADRAVWGGTAQHRGGERPPRRRTPAACRICSRRPR